MSAAPPCFVEVVHQETWPGVPAGSAGLREANVADLRTLATVPTTHLLAELGRRFRVRYGSLTAVFFNGQPGERVEVMHRVRRAIDAADLEATPHGEPTDDTCDNRTTERGSETDGW